MNIFEEYQELRPILTTDLLRLGNKGDGGYVVNKSVFQHTKVLQSFGVSTDWSFEQEFSELNKEHLKEINAFDYSVSSSVFLEAIIFDIKHGVSLHLLAAMIMYLVELVGLKKKKDNTRRFRYFIDANNFLNTFFSFRKFFTGNHRFYKLGISNHRTPPFITFEDSLKRISPAYLSENSVFLKMDIEGSEYQIIDEIVMNQHYINGLMIEFHDLNSEWKPFIRFIRKLKEHYYITHIHGNNCSPVMKFDDVVIPVVVEITFVKKDLIKDYKNSETSLQFPLANLDYPNEPGHPDIQFQI